MSDTPVSEAAAPLCEAERAKCEAADHAARKAAKQTAILALTEPVRFQLWEKHE